jgi:ribosomal protein L29
MKKSIKNLHEKNVKELVKEIRVLKEEITKLSLSKKSSPVKDTNMLFKKKKHLAVLLTVLNEKKAAIEVKK